MGFWEDTADFLFGSSEGTDKKNDLYNQVQNTILDKSNFMKDFETNSANAINQLANRGIINSSVTSGAMANALNQAQQNYINTQLQAYGLLSNIMPQDTTGLIPGLAGAFAGGIGTGLGSGLGKMIGGLF